MKLAKIDVASFIVSLSLLFGFIAMTGYLVQQSLFQPGRFATAAKAVTSSPAVRADMANQITIELMQNIQYLQPTVTPQLDSALQIALLNPQVQSEIINALSEAQNHLMGQTVPSISVGGPAFINSLQAALLMNNPSLASLIGGSSVSVAIPGSTLPNLGRFASRLSAINTIAFAISLVLFVIAFLMAPRKSNVIRKLGIGLILIGIVDIFVFWVVPVYLIPLSNTSWAPLISDVLQAISGTAVLAYMTLFVAGLIAIVGTSGAKRFT